jgi:hypothetical protein
LYTDTGSLFFRFDVGSADSGVVAIGSFAGELKLLTYARNAAGVFATKSVTTLLSGLPQSAEVDLSPDGTRIAYRGSTAGALMVYDIATKTSETWSSGPWAWDFAWIRGGAAIAMVGNRNQNGEPSRLYEISGPGQRVELLSLRQIDAVDVSRTDPNVILLSYNSEDGSQALVGSWRLPVTSPDGIVTNGGWIQPNLAGRSPAFKGTWSCDDRFLIFGGSGAGGQQQWFTRDLPSGTAQLVAKAGNATAQSWSRCASSPNPSSDAFIFRTVGN